MHALARARFPALGSEATVSVTREGALSEAQWIVLDELDAIDRACSRFRADSELTTVNQARGAATPISTLLIEALRVALRAAVVTDGDVDPTVGAALRMLGYDRDFASLVEKRGPVVRFVEVPGWKVIEVDDERGTVRLPVGVQLDLGATAKALAADRAARRAAAETGCGVLVGLGGDVAVAGPAPSNGWAVGVADWHGVAPEDVAETVRIGSGGLATSSTTVRRWARGDDELHHLVDPRTGRSAHVLWRTVTVAAASCVDANVAATAAVIRGERAPAWLGDLRLPSRLVRVDGDVVRVGGWPSTAAA